MPKKISKVLSALSLLFLSTACCPLLQSKNNYGVCVNRGWGSQKEVDSPTVLTTNDSTPSTASVDSREGIIYSWQTDRFTWGQRSLFRDIHNESKNIGIGHYVKGSYTEARTSFLSAISAESNNPELLIFYNNSKSREGGNVPFTLAAVVPVDNEIGNAEEMLRGIAQAQDEFNKIGGIDGRLLEVVIANDGNNLDRDKASKPVAEQLSRDPSILGVIGHNFSDATEAALPTYDDANIAVISPTSTSTSLNNEVFFRTAYKDSLAGEQLAEYAQEHLGISSVVIFYNSQSKYSNSMRQAFEKRFSQLGGIVMLKDKRESGFNAVSELRDSALEDMDAALLLAGQDTNINISKANSDLPPEKQLKLLGGDSLYGRRKLEAGQESLNGMVLSVAWFYDAPCCIDFASKAAERWNGATINWRSATSYDATRAFIKVLSQNVTREEIIEKLKTIELPEDETSGQGLRFDDYGERVGEPVLIKTVLSNKVQGLKVGYELVSVD